MEVVFRDGCYCPLFWVVSDSFIIGLRCLRLMRVRVCDGGNTVGIGNRNVVDCHLMTSGHYSGRE